MYHVRVTKKSAFFYVLRIFFKFCIIPFQLIRLCGLTWADFVELVDIERSGGSGLAWLSQSSGTASSSSRPTPSSPTIKVPEANSSITTTPQTVTSDMWSDEDEVGDSLASPITNFKPIVNRSQRPRLKRAQSERVTSIDLPNYNPPSSPGARGRLHTTNEEEQRQPQNLGIFDWSKKYVTCVCVLNCILELI